MNVRTNSGKTKNPAPSPCCYAGQVSGVLWFYNNSILFRTAAFFFTAGTITVAVAGFTLFTSFAGTCAITAFAFLITARFIFVFHNILQKRLI